MPSLVEYGELSTFLGVAEGTPDQELLEALLAQSIALFEKTCGRERAPFSDSLTGRIEIILADPWSTRLDLDYPIASITSIVVGLDVSAPDETLVPGAATSVVWYAGRREIIRTDGGFWGHARPRWVKVVYSTQNDRPADAKLAVKRRVARLYNERGKEGFTSVTRGERSWSMAGQSADDEDSVWREAVRNHQRSWLR